MEYGEASSKEEMELHRPDGDDLTNYMARDVSVGLYRIDDPREEIFPPSQGQIELIGKKVVCMKKRAVRAPVPVAAPSGPHVIVDQTLIRESGIQWLTFEVGEVQDTGRTLLLRYKIRVEDDEGRYEVLLDGGSRSQRLVRLVRKKMGEA
jgi:hypothetical protein